MLTYGIPLLSMPYLTRKLGLSAFGEYSFLIAIIIYPTMLINFGFDTTSTVTIARLRRNKLLLSEYICSVYILKVFFIIVSISLFIIAYILGLIDFHVLVMLAAFFPKLISLALASTYVFQGFDLVKQMASITIITKLISLPFVFIFINEPDDLLIACLIYSGTFLLTSLVAIYYLSRKRLFYLVMPRWKTVRRSFIEGYIIFKVQCATSVYFNSIPVILGVFHSSESVGIYNVANTLKGVVINLVSSVPKALFPKVSNLVATGKEDEATTLLIYTFIRLFICIVLFVLGSFFISPYLIPLVFGNEFISASFVFNILLIAILMSVTNNFLGVQSLIPLGFKERFSEAVVKSSILAIFGIVPLVYFFDSVGGALGVIFSEVLVCYFLLTVHRKYRNVNILNAILRCNKKLLFRRWMNE